MSENATVPGTESEERGAVTSAQAARPAGHDADSPWHGIPTELLDGTRSYDTDSAGGCG